jgi:hypothetical protein
VTANRDNRPSPKTGDARRRKALEPTVPLKAPAASGKKDVYPVGIPVSPPPGKRGSHPPPVPARPTPVPPREPANAFDFAALPPLPARPTPVPPPRKDVRPAGRHADAAAPTAEDHIIRGAQIVMVVSLVVVCLAIGWFLSHGSKRKRLAERETAQAKEQAQPPKKQPQEPAKPRQQVPPPEPPQQKPPREEPARPRPPDPTRPLPEPTPAGVTFVKDVLPIFEARCVNCHGGRRKRGGLDVRTVAALMTGGDNGPAINGASLQGGTLWENIDTNKMPPGRKKLTPAEKKTVRDWIAGGAR